MAEATLAQRLGEFAAESTALPDEVTESVRKRVLDIVGIAAAAASLETSRAARRWAAEQGGTPEATAIGLPDKLPAAQAAFVNGVLAHSLDYDDTHLPSVLHPSAVVVPAALAAAEATGATGAELETAIAVGLETAVRLGMAGYDKQSNNSVFFEHGQHATSICGAVGGAVSAAKLHRMDAPSITNVIGVVASMASGLIEANRTGGTVKRMHCGWAAHAAVSAVGLVRHGFTGPPTVLEGRFGFFQAWLHGVFDADQITDGLGEEWAVPGIFFKPYPANHFTHAGIDAARRLRATGVDPAKISKIRLGVPRQNLPTVGQPIEVKRTPETGYMAQFSGPYTLVAGLLGGGGLGVGLDDFTDELARDPHRRALMRLVDVEPDEKCTEIFPYQFPAVVTLTLDDGTELTEEVLVNRGGPGDPLSFDELATKFRDNAERALSADTVGQLADAIARLHDTTDLSALLEPLREVDA
ncbi:MmgE/PrpD family protein [Cryptosporangium sp. NPDC048952]|uniref:MmgE/PrpD family protein n=1 Tax=Cryptosporangium sp. NPDC048952 TaxID=3363961 RepID=UPI00371F8902